ncbi:MAG: DUF1848 domain-containing protein [Bacteroidota bacterium]|nr:DUF1848 domain-containing protein [Bacteroidota bacterium]
MQWDTATINLDDGKPARALAPVIVSASRATDIPAFYADWFIHRLKTGYLKWKNPFNGASSYISFQQTRLIVFWSKNPRPLFPYLPYLDERMPNYYFQFTLNDYDHERLEPNVPDVQARIDTFIELSERIGPSKVIWRFDPLILTKQMGVDELLRKIETTGDQLKGHTQKLVISFADIAPYKHVRTNLTNQSVDYLEFDEPSMLKLALGLQQLNAKWGFTIATCAEPLDLSAYGIKHNKCIDDDLIARLFPSDKKLMDFLGISFAQPGLFPAAESRYLPAESHDSIEVCSTASPHHPATFYQPTGFQYPTIQPSKAKSLKDKGQRPNCGCLVSKDIGAYHTCPHLCIYCYANASTNTVLKNWHLHLSNPTAETMTGETD